MSVMAATPAFLATATSGGSTVSAPVVASKKRRVFHVQLSATECTEVNYKDLVKAWEREHGAAPAKSSSAVSSSSALRTIDTNGGAADTSAFGDDVACGSLHLPTPRAQRFDIIERLEKRYGGGAVIGPSVTSGGSGAARGDGDDEANGASGGGGGGGGGGDGYRRGDDDDLYDSEDSFIDDEELQQNIEEIHTQARVQTKHSGFFVNAGDAIETIEHAQDAGERDLKEEAHGKAAKKPKKKGGAESSRAVKAFLDDWSEAASDWQPGADIVEGMEGLRRAVREMTATTPFTKVFPRQLDDALRAVDILVVDAHPNKWRVNGYFATLMTFLPFTKQYLKSNMLRLEARDAGRSVKDEMEKNIATMAIEIAQYAKQAETVPVETVKEAICNDKDLGLCLHRLLLMQDEWITKENDYRQMLKTEDKKNMKEQDFVQLNARQERNRIFNRVLALFPPGLMDLPSLRSISKAAKGKGGAAARKPAPLKVAAAATGAAAAATGAAAGSKASSGPATTTPKRNKLPVVVVAEVPSSSAATPAKRSIKPFKSRLMEDEPLFNETDFAEIVA